MGARYSDESVLFVRLGFIGLGQIGRPMAKRLDAPVVFDVREEAMDGFSDPASNVEEVARRADVISVMVRDDEQVRDVVMQIIAARRGGIVVAVHSTIVSGTAEALSEEAARHGVAVLDAPVSGGSIGASEGTLAVMIGGAPAAFEICRDAFAPWASLVVHAGQVGSGTRMKLARNLITFASFAAVGEAQRLAESAGVDLVALGNVVRHSDKVTGGPGAIMFRATAAPVAEDDPWRDVLLHTRDLGEKDLRLALELAEKLGVDLPVARLSSERLAAGLGVAHE